jgi:hypothetical protein
MKKYYFAIILFISICMFSNCAKFETQSNPRHYQLMVEKPEYKVMIHKGAGEFSQLTAIDNVFNVDIPAMGGGFSKFLWIKYNKSIPEDYKIIRILANDKLIKEFSINEIEQLKMDAKSPIIILRK